MTTTLLQRVQDEADLCRNEGATDIAALLDEVVVAVKAQAAEVDALKQTLHDEIDCNLRLRAMGGARSDETMTTFLERVIRERDAALAQPAAPAPLQFDPEPACWCHRCRAGLLLMSRMILCPSCGNKRCPRASDHDLPCTGSNEPGQPGSVYAAAPEVK